MVGESEAVDHPWDGGVGLFSTLEIVESVEISLYLLGVSAYARVGEEFGARLCAELIAEFEDDPSLTPREVEVLQFAAKGLTNRDIARVIARSENTVKMHLKNLMAKLRVADRTEAVTLSLHRGIIHLGE